MLFIENTGSVCEREPLSIKLLPLNLNKGSRNAKDVLCIFCCFVLCHAEAEVCHVCTAKHYL